MSERAPGNGAAPALVVRDLVAGYEPGLPIVRGVSLAVEAGEVLAILGPNGAGKSTVIKAIAGLVGIESGRVLLGGRDITEVAPHRRIRTGLAYVPQSDNVFAGMTIQENLEVAVAIVAAVSRRDRIDAAYALFPDLVRQRRLAAGRLSGGQRQMLALARALVVAPRVLLLDEPAAGLAPALVERLVAKLREVRATGVAVLLVEQNVRAALAAADRAAILVEGQERLQAPAGELRDHPGLAQLYFGSLRAGSVGGA